MIIHQHDYSSDYQPPIPMIEIVVSRRAGQDELTLKAIVDSGADATMIPTPYLQQLKARKRHTAWLSGTAGGRYEASIYTVVIQIGSHQPMYVDVVGSERHDEVIVGRDVLNQLIVTLNGLAYTVEVST